jgi:hypothetical protein
MYVYLLLINENKWRTHRDTGSSISCHVLLINQKYHLAITVNKHNYVNGAHAFILLCPFLFEQEFFELHTSAQQKPFRASQSETRYRGSRTVWVLSIRHGGSGSGNFIQTYATDIGDSSHKTHEGLIVEIVNKHTCSNPVSSRDILLNLCEEIYTKDVCQMMKFAEVYKPKIYMRLLTFIIEYKSKIRAPLALQEDHGRLYLRI